MSNFWRIFRLSVLAVFIILIQFSFINSFDFVWLNINLVLYFLIYIFIVYDFKLAFWVIFFVGFIFDLLSFNFFGVHTLSLVLSFFVVHFLSINFFTNRSLYSFWLVSVFFVVIYNVLVYLLISSFNIFAPNPEVIGAGFILNTLKELIFVLLLISASFYLFDFERERK
jgi:rod shape-determining protein MreD